MRLLLFFLLAGLFFPVLGAAQSTYYVPDDFPLIQDAIDNSAGGDTIIVRPGTYVEKINFKGKAITLTSEHGPDVTRIDGNKSGTVVTFTSKEGPDSVLEGFTITNGYQVNVCGGGIVCIYSSPTIINNIVEWNSAWGGGGLSNHHCAPVVTNCVFSGNIARGPGGGMNNLDAPTIVTDCLFIGNSADLSGGGMNNLNSQPKIKNCAFIGNRSHHGGGMENFGCSDRLTVTNCLFAGNLGDYGGGMYNYNSFPIVTQCTFTRNSGGAGGGMGSDPSKSAPTVSGCIFWENKSGEIELANGSVTYSCVQGGFPGAGNIQGDPLFTKGPKGFYYLSQIAAGQSVDSPCVDAGGDLASNVGMDQLWTRTDGVNDAGVVDMGYHYGPFLYPRLQTDCFALSANKGGEANLLLLAGGVNGNRNYLVFGTVSGAKPGTPLPGGYVHLPINWDFFTNLILEFVNTPFFVNFAGQLNPAGEAVAVFDTIGPVASGGGWSLNFAFALNNPWDFVSNPVRVNIIP